MKEYLLKNKGQAIHPIPAGYNTNGIAESAVKAVGRGLRVLLGDSAARGVCKEACELERPNASMLRCGLRSASWGTQFCLMKSYRRG